MKQMADRTVMEAGDGASLWVESAPAKINLFLHVTGRRADGYHLLQSLFVYLDLADRLTVKPHTRASRDRLTIVGPMADALRKETGADNLVLRALALLREAGGNLPPLAVTLEKHVPVAAGLGGGSADAAAMVRLGQRILAACGHPVPEAEKLAELALALGADVPPALYCRPSWVEGIGERLVPLDVPSSWADLEIVLVNPNQPLATAAVFRRWAQSGRPFHHHISQPRDAILASPQAFTSWLATETTNDLEPAATALLPDIVTILEALRSCPGCLLARMSGSGATCFALFANRRAAEHARTRLRQEHPDWWTALARIRQSWQGDAAVGV